MPVRFCHEVLHGGFLLDPHENPTDCGAFERWLRDHRHPDSDFRRQALSEIQLRLRRLALQGWRLGNAGDDAHSTPLRSSAQTRVRGVAHVEAMAIFIAEHFQQPITVNEIAAQVGLHPNYAMTLFKRVVGLPVNAYLTRHRLSHAQALLLNGEQKILAIALDCGFGSLSRFYDAFRSHLGCTPKQYRDRWRRR